MAQPQELPKESTDPSKIPVDQIIPQPLQIHQQTGEHSCVKHTTLVKDSIKLNHKRTKRKSLLMYLSIITGKIEFSPLSVTPLKTFGMFK